MNMRRFSFWCRRCPTRILVETETPTPEEPWTEESAGCYSAAEMVGGNSRDGDYTTADLCPACGGPLHEVGALIAQNAIRHPWRPEETMEIHRQWREGP